MVGDREIPDRLIASALEFAVGLAAAGTKTKPPLPFPAELRPFLKFQKLTGKALSEVRRVVEADPVFLERLGSVATRDLLDEAGMLWLTRPDGWEAQLADLAECAGSLDTVAELRRAERRREAAEVAAQRALAELTGLRAEMARLSDVASQASADAAALRRERAALQADLARHQLDLRHAVDRESAAVERAARSQAAALAARAAAAEAERTRDHVLAGRASDQLPAGDGRDAVLAGAASLASELDAQIDTAHRLAKELTRLSEALSGLEPVARPRQAERDHRTAARRRTSSPGRRPVALPGGVYGSSLAASEFLARHQGVVVLVDGYNVAKLAWPRLALEHQRDRCIEAAEDVARRFGTNVAIVFDGASVAGASAPSRRLVRVRFSPEGVSADDVLRAEVAALPPAAPVVVVTNDHAVANDVRAHGANTMTSEQWLELAGRR